MRMRGCEGWGSICGLDKLDKRIPTSPPWRMRMRGRHRPLPPRRMPSYPPTHTPLGGDNPPTYPPLGRAPGAAGGLGRGGEGGAGLKGPSRKEGEGRGGRESLPRETADRPGRDHGGCADRTRPGSRRVRARFDSLSQPVGSGLSTGAGGLGREGGVGPCLSCIRVGVGGSGYGRWMGGASGYGRGWGECQWEWVCKRGVGGWREVGAEAWVGRGDSEPALDGPCQARQVRQ